MRQTRIKTLDQAARVLDQAAEKSVQRLRQNAFPVEEILSQGAKLMNTAKLKDNARQFRDQAVESIHEARDRVVDASKHAVEQVDEEAHKSPWLFVGIAALFSAIFGFFLGRSSKR